ncbi:hypothetical protein [Polaribacter glomeratus]|uniref:Mobilization protein n=1 Tax=Polaribacter glomeratus TaxID=102 RepID=A0A2S7WFW1_9FLAO|nr:hypothetical protein [Polaribacter glomeratus]PQJ76487.1 hypothetical protein BTO16_11315 [Polaribacter glomeratus]TXD64216.1 hypothetical protein ESX12_16010 [Polaribacter glomeratus]
MTLKLSQKEVHMKMKRGVLSEKELLSRQIQKLAKQSNSLSALAQKLIANKLNPYYRKNKLTGVLFKNRKFRLTTLGIDKSKLKELTIEQKRLDGLQKQRYTKEQDRNLER